MEQHRANADVKFSFEISTFGFIDLLNTPAIDVICKVSWASEFGSIERCISAAVGNSSDGVSNEIESSQSLPYKFFGNF